VDGCRFSNPFGTASNSNGFEVREVDSNPVNNQRSQYGTTTPSARSFSKA